MRWTPLLLCLVTNLIFSRVDGKVQLTVDVAGATKTSVNIKPEWPQIPDPIDVVSRTKRGTAVRPFSVETPESGPSSDYETFNPDMGSSTANNIDYSGGSITSPGSNTQASGGQGFGGRQPGRGGQFGGQGGPRGQFGGPNRPNRGHQRMRCRGNSNSPACRNNRGNQGRRGQGRRQPQYSDYGMGQSGPGGQRGPRNQRNRQRNTSGASSGTTEYMEPNY